jgi:hypothetical protein
MNNPTEEHKKAWQEVLSYGVKMYQWQLERGEGETLHIQGCVVFEEPTRFRTLKAKLPAFHLEKCRNSKEALAYCGKEDTRVEGPWSMGLPKVPAKVMDPLLGKSLYPWQKSVLELIAKPVVEAAKETAHQRQIHWYHEPVGNTGKTSLCKHLLLSQPDRVFYYQGSVKKGDLAHGLVKWKEDHGDWPEVLLVDIPRDGGCDYSALESAKNGMLFSGKYETAMILMNPPYILVLANHYPNVSKFSADRWVIHDVPVVGVKRPFSAVSESIEGEEGEM